MLPPGTYGRATACPVSPEATDKVRDLWLVAQPGGAPVPELLQSGPVRVPAGGDLMHVVARRAEVLQIVKDREFEMAGIVVDEDGNEQLRGHPVFGGDMQDRRGGLLNIIDVAEHRAMRKHVNAVFTQSQAQGEDPFARATAGRLAGELADQREAVDLAPTIDRYVTEVVMNSLGLPVSHWDTIQTGSVNSFKTVLDDGPAIEAVLRGWSEVYDFYQQVLDGGWARSHGTIAQVAWRLHAAGYDELWIKHCLANISNGYPAEREALRRIVHELLTRYRWLLDYCLAGQVAWLRAVDLLIDTVALFQANLPRRARFDVTVGGRKYAQGTLFLPSLVGAALDGPHLPGIAFGFGSHRCPGDWLTRLHAAIFLETLFGWFPQARIAGDRREDVWTGFSLAVTTHTWARLQ